MSKRVEVKKHDGWMVGERHELLQVRGLESREVCYLRTITLGKWHPRHDEPCRVVPDAAARAWIESLGGEWAEVAEEKQPQAVVAVDYMHDNGTIWRCVGNSESHKQVEAEIAAGRSPYRRITIAGVP